MTKTQTHFHTDASRDGSSIIGLAHWLDEVDQDLADLTSRLRLSIRNQADAYHNTRTRTLKDAMTKVTETVSELLKVLPAGADDDPDSRAVCLGLISHWLHSESRAHRSAKVGFHGNTDSFHLPSVLQFLAAQKKTGLMKVMATDETFFLELANGDLVHAASDNAPAGERLGEVLVELGILTDAQLQSVVGPQIRQRLRLGLELSDRGLLDDEQLRQGLECQVRRILLRLFTKTNATFEFHEEASRRQATRVRLATLPLLLELAASHDNAQKQKVH